MLSLGGGVIVYHFDRVFRNGVDAGITKRDLKKVGTRIVSTVLDMGDNPPCIPAPHLVAKLQISYI